MDESRHEREGGCVTKLNCAAVVGLRQQTPSKLRVLCNGKTLAFQANDTSSILVTRSKFTGFRLRPVYCQQALLAAIQLRIGVVPKSKM